MQPGRYPSCPRRLWPCHPTSCQRRPRRRKWLLHVARCVPMPRQIFPCTNSYALSDFLLNSCLGTSSCTCARTHRMQRRASIQHRRKRPLVAWRNTMQPRFWAESMGASRSDRRDIRRIRRQPILPLRNPPHVPDRGAHPHGPTRALLPGPAPPYGPCGTA